MEAFSLLNYWTGGGGAAAVATIRSAAAISPPPETPDEEDDFFDIDFTANTHNIVEEDEEDEKYFSFSITSSSEEENFPISTVYTLKPATKLRKFFVKLEEVTIVSLFSRESSSRNLEERAANSKEVVQKYLSKIKPLYVRVSKRYSEKMGFLSAETEDDLKMGKKRQKTAVSSRIKVAYKHLRKRKMEDSTAVIAPRKDDSFLEQQDGIQSAIAHCKRSFASF